MAINVLEHEGRSVLYRLFIVVSPVPGVENLPCYFESLVVVNFYPFGSFIEPDQSGEK